MEIGKLYYGTVSYPPNRQAYYVRVMVSSPGEDLPLSVKATFEKFSRDALGQGTIVRVERTDPDNHCKYRVAEVLNQTKEETDMAMSKDRVRFFLPHRYFQNSARNGNNRMSRDTCKDVLCKAFGMSRSESDHMMRWHPEGFTILCRPSQFGRFIVYRYDTNECINGVKDLQPEVIPKPDVYDDVSRITGVERDSVKRVATALGYSCRSPGISSQIDVSNRKARTVEKDF